MARRNSKEYQKEINKIKRRIRAIEKRGYELRKPFEPQGKSLKQLQKEYSRENIYKKFTYTTEGGTRFSGTEYRKMERSLASKRGWETRRERQDLEGEELPISYEEIVFQNLNSLLNMIEYWTPQPEWTPKVTAEKEKHKNKLKGILEMSISNAEDKTRVADIINRNSDVIYQIANRIMYAVYTFDRVFSNRANYYDPSEDYITLEQLLGQGVFTLEDIEALNETY